MDLDETVWDESLEQLLARYADEAQVRENLHRKSYYEYKTLTTGFQLPIIILSALSGSFQFISKSYQAVEHIITNVTGGVSILVSIISATASYLKLGETMSKHEVAEIAWQRFYNMIKHELNLRRDLRQNAMDFLEECKISYNRLFEISPIVNQSVINNTKKQIKHNTEFKIPNYLNGYSHTIAFDNGGD